MPPIKFLGLLLLLLSLSTWVNGQTPPICNPSTTNRQLSGTIIAPTAVSTNNANWDNNYPGSTGVARFDKPGYYLWDASSNNTVSIGGLILEEGVNLEVGRSNNNEVAAFNINDGCIVVKNGAVLNFTFLTLLKGLNIRVEPGGKLIFNSDASGGSDGQRDDFNFDNVTINLLESTSTIEFGDADINVGVDGLTVIGWTGDAVCTGNVPPSNSGSSGNISWTNETDICEFLTLRILPLEWVYTNVLFKKEERKAEILWGTAKEWENSHFEIERSLNHTSSWEKIGKVNGAGYSDLPVDYTFTDSNLPLAGGMLYYRIKQVDFSGKSAYSKTVGIQAPGIENQKGTWRAYPNPTDGEFFRVDILNKSAYGDEPITFRLHGGKIDSGFKFASTLEEFNFQLLPLIQSSESGILILEIRWENKVEILKILRK